LWYYKNKYFNEFYHMVNWQMGDMPEGGMAETPRLFYIVELRRIEYA